MAPRPVEGTNSSQKPLPYTEMLCPQTGNLYVFGYGSLIWKPNIPFSRFWIGYIKGYKRRFFQGSTTHRGTPENPGRVLTLIQSDDKEARVWGIALEVEGEENIRVAMEHLIEREMTLGGYRFDEVIFHPRSPTVDDNTPKTIRSFVYIATEENESWVGDAPIEAQAQQIATAVGFCGTNVEYLQKTMEFIWKSVPEMDHCYDQYIFDLWKAVMQVLAATNSQATATSSDESSGLAENDSEN